MARYVSAPEFAVPHPMHAMTDAAVAGVEAVRAHGAGLRLQAELSRLVTDHGRPQASKWEGDPVARNARPLLDVALARGFTAQMIVEGDACSVEGYRLEPERIGFRAVWLRGSAFGFTWHEPWRYEMTQDTRPVSVDARAKVGKAGYRAPGVGRSHMRVVASPWGVKIGYDALVARLRALPEMVGS